MKNNKEEVLARLAESCKNTLMETLDITYIDFGEDFLVAQMPVTPKVHQPDGVLHGGAMVALAESVGSAASFMFLNQEHTIRGIEISANHVKSKREGMVYAKATFIHKGRTTQLWNIDVVDENDALISKCKLTTIALPRK
ncbi:PaaI family thioesterase [uncultured Dokdonia sp.]|jgi:1,4-dihydroxy-2-naphthoyl-CoA hydrolase|uniref:PaaI family thioesterase n=1 Tax=unclassified Dokdonia TaxID=2615033 RepID=UPI00261E1E3C|nr:hotdog fold thioesterase [uncultured Dokdonia sp.]|tara:strand:- start:7751 stop:8170 length:420 start_codon:yes stop_codon:yes gene_type:complete